MADSVRDNPPIPSRKRPSAATKLLPPLLFLGAMMISADFTAIDLRPLKALQIPYLTAMDYAHFIIPGFCSAIWLATVWKWPNAGSIVSVLLCFVLIGQIPAYAERRMTRLPVTRWLETDEAMSFESRVGFSIFQTGSKEGLSVIVAPGNASRAQNELRRLGIVPSGQPAAG